MTEQLAEALRELVECKRLADQFNVLKQEVHDFATAVVLEGTQAEYQRRKPLAWAAAESALAAWDALPQASWDEKALEVATTISLMQGHDRSQFVSKIQVAVLDAMRNALDAHDAQPKQEPVCQFVSGDNGNYPVLRWRSGYVARIGDKFYAAPAQGARAGGVGRRAC